MPASSIIVNGRSTRSPNVYSEVDASSMVTNGIGLTSLVVIGDAIGGKPASAFESSELPLISATTPDEVASIFVDGDLRDAGLLAFKASNDAKIPSAPQRVLFYKTNDSTQSTLALKGVTPLAGLADVMTVNSIQYGGFANQIRMALSSGTNGGIKATVSYQGSDDEVYDDVGAEEILSVGVDTGAQYNSANISVGETAITSEAVLEIDSDAFKYEANVTASKRNNLLGTASLKITLSEAVVGYDLPVTIFGTDTADAPTKVVTEYADGTTTAIVLADPIKFATGIKVGAEFKGTINLVSVDGGDTTVQSLTGRITNYLPVTAEKLKLSVVAETTDVATIIGKNLAGSVVTEDVLPTVAGADTVNSYVEVQSITFSAPTTADITAKIGATADIFTILATGTSTWGNGGYIGIEALSLPVSSRDAAKLQLVFSNAPAQDGLLILRGKVGTVDTAEKLLFTAQSNSVASTVKWTELEHVELLECANSSDTPFGDTSPTFNLQVESLFLEYGVLSLADLVVNLGAVQGLSASTVRDGSSSVGANVVDLGDLSVTRSNTGKFYATSFDLEQALSSSSLVRASAIKRVRPSATPTRLFSGGSDFGFTSGTVNTSSTTASFINAFARLQGLKNVVIVPLSEDASVHKALADHCKHMEGLGRDERNGYVGLPASANKADIKSKIRSLNSRNVSAVAQSLKAFDELGTLKTYSSPMLAVVAGAMQCGSPVGMPLTNKILNCTEVGNTGDWSPSTALEEMLEMSLMFARFDQERGVVWERSLTTWRQDSNSAFTEMSTNESVNVSTKLCRKSVENRIGDRAFAGLAGLIKALISSELQRQIDSGIIKSYAPASIAVQDNGDSFGVQYEIAPLEPVNFIKITAHLKRQPVSA